MLPVELDVSFLQDSFFIRFPFGGRRVLTCLHDKEENYCGELSYEGVQVRVMFTINVRHYLVQNGLLVFSGGSTD